MRVALVLIALLALSTAEARADVFVPADPPAKPAGCAAIAGDVVAAAGDGLESTTVSGPWEPISDHIGCPIAAGAADGTIAIAGGHAGGGWSAPAPLSAQTRNASQPAAGFDATGPRVVWSEDDVGVRGARPVPDAPVDATPPEVTVRVNAQPIKTREDVVSIPVRVRCSEACDAHLESSPLQWEARSLAAGQEVKVLLAATVSIAYTRPSVQRVRFTVVVTDRAGNARRVTRTARVRILRRPLRTFKVSADYDLSTCTTGGNRRLVQLVNSIIDGLAGKSLRSARDIRRAWGAGVGAIERAFPDECLGDTEVRERVYAVLHTPLSLAGYPDFYLDE